jgi:hypothetical protein
LNVFDGLNDFEVVVTSAKADNGGQNEMNFFSLTMSSFLNMKKKQNQKYFLVLVDVKCLLVV